MFSGVKERTIRSSSPGRSSSGFVRYAVLEAAAREVSQEYLATCTRLMTPAYDGDGKWCDGVLPQYRQLPRVAVDKS